MPDSREHFRLILVNIGITVAIAATFLQGKTTEFRAVVIVATIIVVYATYFIARWTRRNGNS